ncbi:MAG: metallophosphoesterase [Verrucomicrobiota bacterium]
MPGIFYTQTERRSFLKTIAAGTGALVVSGCATRRADASQKKLHLALLSDTHIPGDRKNGYRGFNPWENLKRTVPEVVAARPDGVLLNGDAARLEGHAEDYAQVKELLEPVASFAPVYIGMGNHDDRGQFAKVFKTPASLKQNVQNKHVLVVDEDWMRVIVLDSLLYTNKTAGYLGKNQRDWLATYLQTNSEKPAVIFVHHTLGDGEGECHDARELFEIAGANKQVKAIFYGHSHVWSLGQKDRLKLINLPAVGYNFSDQQPVGWVDARFDLRGVDLTLHAFGGNRTDDGKTTRVEWA